MDLNHSNQSLTELPQLAALGDGELPPTPPEMRTRAQQAPRAPSAAARSAPEGRADLPLPCPAPTSLLLGLHGLHGGHGRPLRLGLVLRLHGRPHGLGADLRVADVAGERERGEVRAQRARGGPEGFPGGFPEGSPRSPPAPLPEAGLPPVRHHGCPRRSATSKVSARRKGKDRPASLRPISGRELSAAQSASELPQGR